MVELWAFDEHRVGLLPIARRVWAPKGQRPILMVQPRYEWLYLYGFVQPQTGRTHFVMLPRMNGALFWQALADFARTVGAGPLRQVMVVLDGAPAHRSGEVAVPEGIHLLFVPPYSPELQPAERLWPLTNEAVANRHFAALSELETAQQARCAALAQMPDQVRASTLFSWWPRIGK